MTQLAIRSVAATLVLIAASATELHAAFYAGASFTVSEGEFETAVDGVDTDDSSWKAFAGFTFLEHLALEASYRDFGSFEDRIGASAFAAELEAFDFGVRGIVPLGKIAGLFAKIGYANVQTELAVQIGNSVFPFDDDDWLLLYGVGVDFFIGRRFGVRAEWEAFDVEGSGAGLVSHEGLSSLSAGAFFRF